MKKHRFALLLLLSGSLAAVASSACAQAAAEASALPKAWAQRVEEIARHAAENAVAAMPGARVEVQAGQLDPRLKLAPCDQVDIYLPNGQRAWGNTRVGLRCIAGAGRWNVFLPLSVRVFAPAVQSTSALAAGTVLSAEHLQVAVSEWSISDSAAFARSEGVVGRRLSRPLAAGATIRESDLKKRQLFAVGDVVKVIAVGDGFSIASEGVALTHGFEGQTARIRTEGGRTVTGVASGERRVQVSL